MICGGSILPGSLSFRATLSAADDDDHRAAHRRRTDEWIEAFFARAGSPCDAPGRHRAPRPSHALESLAAQERASDCPRERFLATVDESDRDRCHNMRGEVIDPWTAPTHRLFEWIASRRLPVATIGIGDGGNEIGMGRLAWETIVEAVDSDVAGKIACRVATDFTLVGGVSDWAAYALALAVTRLRGGTPSGDAWTGAAQGELVALPGSARGCRDGVTLRPEATVDGLALDAYLDPLVEMRKLLNFRAE